MKNFLLPIPCLALGIAAVVVAADPVADCRRAHANDPDAHIACLERALGAAGDRGQPTAESVTASPEQSPQQSPQEPSNDSSAASTSDASAGPAADLPGDRAAAPAEAVTGLGAEQVQARVAAGDDAEEARVRIVSARYDAGGMGTYVMADGQVWRETTASPERRRLEADREYEGRIERSFLGGYRLYVDGVRHMKTVRRVE